MKPEKEPVKQGKLGEAQESSPRKKEWLTPALRGQINKDLSRTHSLFSDLDSGVKAGGSTNSVTARGNEGREHDPSMRKGCRGSREIVRRCGAEKGIP